MSTLGSTEGEQPITEKQVVITGLSMAVNRYFNRRGQEFITFSVANSDNPFLRGRIRRGAAPENYEAVFTMAALPDDATLPIEVDLRRSVKIREFTIDPTVSHLMHITDEHTSRLRNIESATLSRRNDPNNLGAYELTLTFAK